MKEIVFFGDLLRFQKTNPFHADRMAGTLHELFRGQIAAATGIKPELVLAREAGRFDRRKFYSLSGHGGDGGPDEAGWARIASGDYDRAAAAYFAECFRGALVISHEAGSLLRVMDDAGVDYLDFRVAPLRFLDDIFFCFKSSLPAVSERLLRHRMPLDDVPFHVNRLRARYRMQTCAGLPPNSLLVCGQSGADLSLIRDGRMATMRDCLERLRETMKEYDRVYYKKHPAPGDRDLTWEALRALRSVRRVGTNIYRLLCDDNLAGVAALSSGVLTEARFFGKRAHFLSHEYIGLSGDESANGAEEYVMTRDGYFSPAFWSDVLSPCFATRECREFRFSGGENMLRSLVDGWWGYEPARDGGSARAGRGGALGILKRAADRCDPDHALRRRIDPGGAVRRRIVKFLS